MTVILISSRNLLVMVDTTVLLLSTPLAMKFILQLDLMILSGRGYISSTMIVTVRK